MKPVLVIPGTDYVVCFDTEAEDLDMRQHFVGECGWTEEQFEEIEDMPWFSVKLSLWRKGRELDVEYLGACCYKTEDEFWTTYAADYFSDMVCELLAHTSHHGWAQQWRQDLRNKASSTLKDPA